MIGGREYEGLTDLGKALGAVGELQRAERVDPDSIEPIRVAWPLISI